MKSIPMANKVIATKEKISRKWNRWHYVDWDKIFRCQYSSQRYYDLGKWCRWKIDSYIWWKLFRI